MSPGSDARDGPLPAAPASHLKLGHVVVANMTGNVVFLGFAIAGAGGLSVVLRSSVRRSPVRSSVTPGAWPQPGAPVEVL